MRGPGPTTGPGRRRSWGAAGRAKPSFASATHPSRAPREQVAERLDVGPIGAHDAVVERELVEQLNLLGLQALHLLFVVSAHLFAVRIHDDALAGLEVFEAGEP